jgi:flotillin
MFFFFRRYGLVYPSHMLAFLESQTGTIIAIVGGMLVINLIFIVIYSSRVVKVPVNTALIVTGQTHRHKRGHRGYKIVKGGRCFVWPIFEQADMLSLEIFKVEFRAGRFSGTLTTRIKGDVESISAAAERFLSKNQEELAQIVKEVMEGHAGASRDEKDPDQAGIRIQESAAPALEKLGLEIVSLNMR